MAYNCDRAYFVRRNGKRDGSAIYSLEVSSSNSIYVTYVAVQGNQTKEIACHTEFETKQRMFAEHKIGLQKINAKHEMYGPFEKRIHRKKYRD